MNEVTNVTDNKVAVDDTRLKGKPAPATVEPAKAEPKLDDKGQPIPEIKKSEEKIAKVVSKVNKREQALAEKERVLKEQEAAIQAFKDAPELAKTKPLELLKKLGIDPQAFLNDVAKSGEAPTVDDEIKAIKAELEAEKKRNLEREQKLNEREAEITIHNFKQQINRYVDDKKDTESKLTKLLGREEDVYAVIEAHHTKTLKETGTGELLPIDKAVKMVEDHYVAAKKKEYDILKGYFEPTDKPANQTDNTDITPKTPTKTLTNKSGPTIPQGEDRRVLSNKESFAKLAAKYPKDTLV